MRQPLDASNRQSRQVWLAARLAAHVQLVWTDNRTVMLSVRSRGPASYEVRLHHMFHHASDAVWQALAAYIRDASTAAQRTLRTYIQYHQHLVRQTSTAPKRPRAFQPQGHHFDLEAIYHHLNRTYFNNQVEARITWSRRAPQRPRTSIRFGSYHSKDRLIRIHPLLDQPFVPRYVVEDVVFHEMLHQLVPCQRLNGRWLMHSPAFRQQEQRYPHHQRAEQWKQRYLNRLLRG